MTPEDQLNTPPFLKAREVSVKMTCLWVNRENLKGWSSTTKRYAGTQASPGTTDITGYTTCPLPNQPLPTAITVPATADPLRNYGSQNITHIDGTTVKYRRVFLDLTPDTLTGWIDKSKTRYQWISEDRIYKLKDSLKKWYPGNPEIKIMKTNPKFLEQGGEFSKADMNGRLFYLF